MSKETEMDLLDVPYGNPDNLQPYGEPADTSLYIALSRYILHSTDNKKGPTLSPTFSESFDERSQMKIIEIRIDNGSRLIYTHQYNRRENSARESVHAVAPQDKSNARFVLERAENPALTALDDIAAGIAEPGNDADTFFYTYLEPGKSSLGEKQRQIDYELLDNVYIHFNRIKGIVRNAEERYSRKNLGSGEAGDAEIVLLTKKNADDNEGPIDIDAARDDSQVALILDARQSYYPELPEAGALERMASDAENYTALNDIMPHAVVHETLDPEPTLEPEPIFEPEPVLELVPAPKQKMFEWLSLADIPLKTHTETGVAHSQFEIENLMMGTLAASYRHIFSLQYDHLVATMPRRNKVFYFGPKDLIEPYTAIPESPLSDAEEVQLRHRMQKAFDKLNMNAAEKFIEKRGQLYMAMNRFCMQNDEHVFVAEPEEGSAEYMFRILNPLKGTIAFYSQPPGARLVDGVPTVSPDFLLEGLIEQVMGKRGGLKSVQVLDVKNTALRLKDKTILFVGDSTQDQATAYMTNRSNLVRWSKTDLYPSGENLIKKQPKPKTEEEQRLDKLVLDYVIKHLDE
ncbi:hypothetical protein ACFL3V_00375 [Nanoarchaeota archaeon]